MTDENKAAVIVFGMCGLLLASIVWMIWAAGGGVDPSTRDAIFNATNVRWASIVCLGMWLAQRVAERFRPDLMYSDEVYARIAAEAGGTPGMVKHSLFITAVLLQGMAYCVDYVAAHPEFLG